MINQPKKKKKQDVYEKLLDHFFVCLIGEDEDYTTVCLLGYEYIKNRYRLIAHDSSRQKELDADPKAIQHIQFFGQ